MDVAQARLELTSRSELEVSGMSSRGIHRAVAQHVLQQVMPGWYVDRQKWDAAFSEGRHLLRVVANHQRAGSPAVNALTSAVVLHELPLFRTEPERVHLYGKHLNGQAYRSKPLVARHRIDLPKEQIVEIDGIPCTSLARTVADMLRTARAAAALAVADAALASVAWDRETWTYDEDAAERLRAEVDALLPAGARGVRRARRLLELADGRAGSPGESASRLHLLTLGFAPPRLQVAVPGPHGRDYHVDFGLDDANAWGEFDGKGKYLEPALRGAHTSIEEAVLAEKEREDWIRGTTQRALGRWGDEHLGSAEILGARLAKFKIIPGAHRRLLIA